MGAPTKRSDHFWDLPLTCGARRCRSRVGSRPATRRCSSPACRGRRWSKDWRSWFVRQHRISSDDPMVGRSASVRRRVYRRWRWSETRAGVVARITLRTAPKPAVPDEVLQFPAQPRKMPRGRGLLCWLPDLHGSSSRFSNRDRLVQLRSACVPGQDHCWRSRQAGLPRRRPERAVRRDRGATRHLQVDPRP